MFVFSAGNPQLCKHRNSQTFLINEIKYYEKVSINCVRCRYGGTCVIFM